MSLVKNNLKVDDLQLGTLKSEIQGAKDLDIRLDASMDVFKSKKGDLTIDINEQHILVIDPDNGEVISKLNRDLSDEELRILFAHLEDKQF